MGMFSAARNDLSLGQEFKPERARDRLSFYQTNIDDVPQSVHGTAARADQRVAGFVVIEIFRAERADGDQPVGAGIAELDEQAGAGNAGNPALEAGADAGDEMMGDQAVGGL